MNLNSALVDDLLQPESEDCRRISELSLGRLILQWILLPVTIKKKHLILLENF